MSLNSERLRQIEEIASSLNVLRKYIAMSSRMQFHVNNLLDAAEFSLKEEDRENYDLAILTLWEIFN